MDPHRFGHVKQIFIEALDLDPGDRTGYLEQACGGDRELYRAVKGLLDEEEHAGEFLESPAVTRLSMPSGTGTLVGQRLGRYLVTQVINSGGMGTVYEAQQEDPRRTVALKVLGQGLETRAARQRFIYESQILARLEHPGIATVIDAGSYDDAGRPRPYFVMEYVPDALPITEYARGRRLDTLQRLDLFDQVCAAVHHGHQRGVIHRDLKPGNILVDGTGQVKIIDFGVARATDSDIARTTVLTEVGQIIGTIQYMSPEQCAADPESLDVRSDVYSLGLVLYELLCGVLPYDVQGATLVSAVQMIQEAAPPAPSMADRSLAGDLDTVLLKALEKEPAFRYQTIAELQEDLRRHRAGEVVRARPTGPIQRLGKWIGRNPRAGFLAGLALVLSISFLGYALLWSYPRMKAEKERLHQAYQRILGLSDVKRLANLQSRAAKLWPATPKMVPHIETWIREAESLLDRVPEHRQALRAMRAHGRILDMDSSDRHWVFEDLNIQWEHDALLDLLGKLDATADPEQGILAQVKQRLAFARTVRENTIDRHRADWDRAIADIANNEKCPAYRGLRLTEQIGLVPLGPDPDSGLWEFAHLQTGLAPKRGTAGHLRLTEDTGLVFILLPGGSFTMGADRPAPGRPPGTPNVDRWAGPDEGPARPAAVEPFFISKYEMTQGQWQRFAGSNPSYYDNEGPEHYKPRWNRNGDPHSWLLPVEQVSWLDCDIVLQRLDLRIPTEAEWEYAARAGTTTVWWTGDQKETLAGAANIKDVFFHLNSGLEAWNYEEWLDDGQVVGAPVGLYRANPFGLHDVCGNLQEWCMDDAGEGHKAVRGGEWPSDALACRSAYRTSFSRDGTSKSLGVRPARSVER